MQTLADIGESEIIRRITAGLESSGEVVTGPGDDCAVIRPAAGGDCDWVLTSDPVIENRHFTRDADFAKIGHKAVARTLSDIAAMGADPAWALVNIVAPADLPIADLETLNTSMQATASRDGMLIIGGDVSQGPELQVHVFGIGRCPTDAAVLRSGARVGDTLYVTGELGGSQLRKHLCFQPRVAEGQFLRHWATAMLDLSDGLATDSHHLAEQSNVGLRLNLSAIPIAPDADQLYDEHSPLFHALTDGEDFELLFCVAADRCSAFEAAWTETMPLPCCAIGEITDAPDGVVTVDADGQIKPLTEEGFQHFRAR